MINVLNVGVLCNGAQLVEDNGKYQIVGDPTEGSLLTAAAKTGVLKKDKEKEFSFIDEIPFDSNRKKMTIIRQNNGKIIAFVKGAPDVMLHDCDAIEKNNQIFQLTNADKGEIFKINDTLTSGRVAQITVFNLIYVCIIIFSR